ncbi:MAG: hypothetical protein H0U69_09420 [Trueperaceae bacterium]|nr:hypothetical protein [Trueperaceae bacterium]
MRVGFVTPLLWERFGPPWVGLIADLGADVVVPGPEEVALALEDARPSAALALAPRLAVAAAVACGPVDLIVVPELIAARDGGRGAAQDPWVADLPAMVARALPGGPGVLRVPVEPGPLVAAAAMPVLMRVNRDAGTVRRAWERRRRELETPWRRPGGSHGHGPARSAADTEGPRVALVGPPWWLTEGGVALAGAGARSLTGQHHLDPEEARAEGRRVTPDLVDPDAEVVGAARRFARQREVDVVRLVVDASSTTAPWLERRVREVAGRNVEVVAARDLADDATWARASTPASPAT